MVRGKGGGGIGEAGGANLCYVSVRDVKESKLGGSSGYSSLASGLELDSCLT